MVGKAARLSIYLQDTACQLPLGHPSATSGTCAVQISSSKRQCGKLVWKQRKVLKEMFVWRNVRKNQGWLVGRCFFFSVRACESLLFSESKKHSSFLTFMLSIYSCYSCCLSLKELNKKQPGHSEDFFFFFFFWEIEKKKLAGFLRVGRITANKHFFMPNYETTLYKWHSRGGAAMRQLSGELVLCWFQTNLPLAALPLRTPRDHYLLFQSYSSQWPRCFGFITERHRSRVE